MGFSTRANFLLFQPLKLFLLLRVLVEVSLERDIDRVRILPIKTSVDATSGRATLKVNKMYTLPSYSMFQVCHKSGNRISDIFILAKNRDLDVEVLEHLPFLIRMWFDYEFMQDKISDYFILYDYFIFYFTIKSSSRTSYAIRKLSFVIVETRGIISNQNSYHGYCTVNTV